uniref:Uncharacterized protein n=1 Tax=Acrobeloides nanus TaxID=290746 RepID=A0A914C832_9BILA
MLNFCNGLDDNVEVVLQGCTVRNNRVFVEDRLIRPLNALEREKINQVLATRIQTTLIFRKKRFTDNHEPSIMSHVPYMSQHDMTDILKQILNVNSTIAERFLPVVKMSPILSEVAASAENSTIELDDTPKEPNNTSENSAEQKMSQYSPTESGEEEHSERRRSPKRSEMSIESLTIPKPPNMTPNDATTDDINDPIIQKLIQSLTSGQHNAELAKQELTQKVGQHPPFYVLPPGIGSSLKPGDTTVIGGQTYVAVPLSMAFPNGNLQPNANLQPPPTNFGSNQAQSPYKKHSIALGRSYMYKVVHTITHRLSSIQNSNAILYIENGKNPAFGFRIQIQNRVRIHNPNPESGFRIWIQNPNSETEFRIRIQNPEPEFRIQIENQIPKFGFRIRIQNIGAKKIELG